MTGFNFPHLPCTLKAWLLAALLAAASGVSAQTSERLPDDPPSQVARLGLTEGRVSMAVASGLTSPDTTVSGLTPTWQAAELNQPLTGGDQIWSDKGARAELQVGSTTLRLGALSRLDLLQLNDRAAQLRLNEGSLRLRVRNLYDGQRLDIHTPNLAFTVTQPGDYRLDVNRAADATRVVVFAGSGLIQGERTRTEPLTISAQQQGSFSGTQLTAAAPGAAVQDSFDRWAMARDRQEDQSPSARFVPRDVVGYQQLDTYGDWQQDARFGAVWLPRDVATNWAPYREGQWRWTAPWGWTWVDDAPWGFAPFHYGRWAQIGARWGWVPGHLAPRPVYAPALVGFVGRTPGTGTFFTPPASAGWFPLAPGEAFRPDYRASPRDVLQVNHNTVVDTLAVALRYQHQASAISRTASADSDAMDRSRAGRPMPAVHPLQFQPMPAPPTVTRQTGPLAGGSVTRPGNGAVSLPSHVSRGNDHVLGGTDGQLFSQLPQRAPDALLEADIEARRDQFGLQYRQRRQLEALAWQQDVQRQREQAPVGERAMHQQREQEQQGQAGHIGRQMQDTQRYDFQHAQPPPLQRQRIQPPPFHQPSGQPQTQLQTQPQLLPPEAVGQQALQEQAQRQQQSRERVRAQQAAGFGRDPGAQRGMVRGP